jgi:hypothetical protein
MAWWQQCAIILHLMQVDGEFKHDDKKQLLCKKFFNIIEDFGNMESSLEDPQTGKKVRPIRQFDVSYGTEIIEKILGMKGDTLEPVKPFF